MVRRIPGYWFAETVEVRPYAGSGAYGDAFGDPFTVPGNLDSRRTSLVGGSTGETVAGEATIHLPPVLADGTDTLTAVPEQSEVTVRARTGVAVAVKPVTARGAVVYVEVTTT